MAESKNHADTYHRHGEPDASKWDEAQAVTGREPDTAPENSTFATRAKQVQSGENKAVQASEAKSLDDMTKAELQAEADRRGVDVPASATKAEIRAALEG